MDITTWTKEEVRKWCHLLAIEWGAFPAYLSQMIIPLLFIFFPWYFVLLSILIIDALWCLIRYRFVSVSLAYIATIIVTVFKWPVAIGSAIYLFFNHHPFLAVFAMVWPLIAGLISILPGKIGVLELAFIMKLFRETAVRDSEEAVCDSSSEPTKEIEFEKHNFPGVKQNIDGTIDFSFSDEEMKEVKKDFGLFKGLYVNSKNLDKIQNMITAVSLSRYAKDLVLNCEDNSESDDQADWQTIQKALEKAVSAVWKSYSLCSFPIFLYHRAVFLQMLGMKNEAHQLFTLFLKRQSTFKMEQIDEVFLDHEGTDIKHAIADAQSCIK